MRKSILIIAAAVMAVACTGVKQSDYMAWSVKMADSEVTRGVPGANVDSPRFKWDYAVGVDLKALLDIYDATGDEKYYAPVLEFADKVVAEDGSIKTYQLEEYNIDRVNTGKIFFRIYDKTGNEKYRKALDLLRSQLDTHPRNEDGGLWHKAIYPHQMWLDGLYMGGPFWAEYTARYGNRGGDVHEAWQGLITWFRTMDEHCYDPATDLYRHACDVSCQMPWADKETGWSDHCWGRGMGWFFMSAVDALPFIPEDEPGRDVVLKVINKLASMVARTQDESGAWYQVIDRSGDEDNYLEATCTAMYTYSLLKAVRLGYIDKSYLAVAKKGFEGFIEQFVSEDENGLLSTSDCCMGAGLGGTPYRSGDYNYYVHEARRGSNSTFANGPFIMAGIELQLLGE